MKIDKKILAGLTAVSMLTCGICCCSGYIQCGGDKGSCIGYCDGSVGRIHYRD